MDDTCVWQAGHLARARSKPAALEPFNTNNIYKETTRFLYFTVSEHHSTRTRCCFAPNEKRWERVGSSRAEAAFGALNGTERN